jgi:hypothetical protein
MLSTGEPPEGANIYRRKGARRQTGRCATVELHRTRIAACRTYHEYERGALPRSIAATVKLGESGLSLSGIDRSRPLGDRPAQLQTGRVSIDALLNLLSFGPRAAIK